MIAAMIRRHSVPNPVAAPVCGWRGYPSPDRADDRADLRFFGANATGRIHGSAAATTQQNANGLFLKP